MNSVLLDHIVTYVWLNAHEIIMVPLRDAAKKGGEKDPLVAPSEVPLTGLCIHVRKQWVYLKFWVLLQIWAKGLDVNISYGDTFNIDTKNTFICLFYRICC